MLRRWDVMYFLDHKGTKVYHPRVISGDEQDVKRFIRRRHKGRWVSFIKIQEVQSIWNQ